MGNLPQALNFFEQYNLLTKELYEGSPNNVSFKNGLAISYAKLGETHSDLGNLQQALIFFEEQTILFKELYEAFPNNVSFKNGLATSYSKLGQTHADMGNLQQALSFFERSNLLTKELYEAFPNNVSFKNGLAIAYIKLAVVYRDHYRDMEKVRGLFEDARRHLQELIQLTPQNTAFQQNLAWVAGEHGELCSPTICLAERLFFISSSTPPLQNLRIK